MALQTCGTSLLKIWSCKLRVPVEIITLPCSNKAGTKYAHVLPVPVPASATNMPFLSRVSSMA